MNAAIKFLDSIEADIDEARFDQLTAELSYTATVKARFTFQSEMSIDYIDGVKL